MRQVAERATAISWIVFNLCPSHHRGRIVPEASWLARRNQHAIESASLIATASAATIALCDRRRARIT